MTDETPIATCKMCGGSWTWSKAETAAPTDGACRVCGGTISRGPGKAFVNKLGALTRFGLAGATLFQARWPHLFR